MLLKLTGIAQPDLNQGKPPAVYIETTQILSLVITSLRPHMIAAIDDRLELLERVWAGVTKLAEKVNGYQPNMEDPAAAGWMMHARTVSNEVMQAYQAANKTDRNQYMARVECTEISLTSKAESGNILRVWVMETPDQVAAMANPFAMAGMKPGQIAAGMPARIIPADGQSTMSGK